MPSVRGLRPTATRISAASIVAAVVELDRDPGAGRADRWAGRRCARRRRGSRAAPPATCSPAKGSSRGSSRSSPSIRVTCVPRRRPGLRQLASRPGRRRARPCSPAPASRSSPRGCSRPHRVEPVDRRHRGAAAGRDDDHLAAMSTSRRRARGARRRACPRRGKLDPAFFQPGQLAGVVEVVDHLVAAVEHRLRIELAAHRLGDARHPARLGEQVAGSQQRLRGHAGVVGALAADQVLLDDRHRQPAVGQPPGADLARRPGAEHDRVELPSRSRRYSYPTPYNRSHIARGRQASTWSVRANGCRSRLPEASLNPGTNQYVRTMSSPSLPS